MENKELDIVREFALQHDSAWTKVRFLCVYKGKRIYKASRENLPPGAKVGFPHLITFDTKDKPYLIDLETVIDIVISLRQLSQLYIWKL